MLVGNPHHYPKLSNKPMKLNSAKYIMRAPRIIMRAPRISYYVISIDWISDSCYIKTADNFGDFNLKYVSWEPPSSPQTDKQTNEVEFS
jgi:hypothetical protein